MAQQVALIYTGINGYLDEFDLGDVKSYCSSLLKYLGTSKTFIEIVTTTNQFTEEAETALKEAISESTDAFVKS